QYIRIGSVVIASGITLYFFRQNLLGIHESSDKALWIMKITTVMAVVMLIWCGITLATKGAANSVPWQPDLDRRVELETAKVREPESGEEGEQWIKDPETGKLKTKKLENGQEIKKSNDALQKLHLDNYGLDIQDDPLGALGRYLPTSVTKQLRHPESW